MKDKDTKLIWEAYGSYEEDLRTGDDPDVEGGYPGDEAPEDDQDVVRAYKEGRAKEDIAAEVKSRFNIDVEWHGRSNDPNDGGEWHRTDVHFLADNKSRVVTDDELEKIMIIEDPEKALERWPSLRKHPELFNSAFSDDKAAEEEIFPPENGRRY